MFLIGLLFRRWWGGWFQPNHLEKVIFAYPLSFLTAFSCTFNIYASLVFALIIGTSFNNPFHSWGMGMGFDRPGKSTLACIAVMGGSYGFFTTLAAIDLAYFTQNNWFLLYALNGFLSPVVYYLCWRYNFKPSIFGGFLDGTCTAPSECALGLLLFGV